MKKLEITLDDDAVPQVLAIIAQNVKGADLNSLSITTAPGRPGPKPKAETPITTNGGTTSSQS